MRGKKRISLCLAGQLELFGLGDRSRDLRCQSRVCRVSESFLMFQKPISEVEETDFGIASGFQVWSIVSTESRFRSYEQLPISGHRRRKRFTLFGNLGRSMSTRWWQRWLVPKLFDLFRARFDDRSMGLQDGRLRELSEFGAKSERDPTPIRPPKGPKRSVCSHPSFWVIRGSLRTRGGGRNFEGRRCKLGQLGGNPAPTRLRTGWNSPVPTIGRFGSDPTPRPRDLGGPTPPSS